MVGGYYLEEKLIVLTSEGLGNGRDELGHVLLANFLRTLVNRADKPAAVILMHDAVKLACPGSAAFEAQEHLRELSRETSVLSCRTCLESHDLVEMVEIGGIGGMAQFVEMMSALAVITF
jgi:hypothetical protein